MPRNVTELSEREILALAITLEEEDSRIYADFADGLRDRYPASAQMFDAMRAEENTHRNRLIDVFRERFGDSIPLVRREDVRGFSVRKPVWLVRPLGIDVVRKQARDMEFETRRFYERAAQRVIDAGIRKLLGELADAEREHIASAESLEQEHNQSGAQVGEAAAERRQFVLQIVQPGLAGLMDGSVSTLAPVFAAAFATHNSWEAFLVGLAASVGAGISMGFAEALSDDGALSGRGQPLVRGTVCGVLTAAGGIGHTLPYLIADFQAATALAIVVVVLELAAISYIRHRFMETPWFSATVQVGLGGALVFLAGLVIGNS